MRLTAKGMKEFKKGLVTKKNLSAFLESWSSSSYCLPANKGSIRYEFLHLGVCRVRERSDADGSNTSSI